MQQIIKNSINMELIQNYPLQTYLLNTQSENKANFFEIEIIIDDTIYRYGFSIYEKGLIEKEFLEQKKMISKARWNTLFTRKQKNIKLSLLQILLFLRKVKSNKDLQINKI